MPKKNKVVLALFLEVSSDLRFDTKLIPSNMASRRPDLAQYPSGFTILRIFQAVLSIITIVVTSFTIHAIVLPGNALLTVAVRFRLTHTTIIRH